MGHPAPAPAPAPSQQQANVASGAQQRMRSIMDGLISPFKACVQPPVDACMGEFGSSAYAPPTSHSTAAATTATTTTATARLWNPNIGAVARQPNPNTNNKRPQPPPYTLSANFSENHSYGSSSPRSQSSNSISIVESPRENDVLCGRGGNSNRHTGNLRFRQLIAANKKQYSTLTKKQKMMLARQIVDVVHHAGGRFLARDTQTGYFYNVGLPRSLEKTSQALRERHSGGSSSYSNSNAVENTTTATENHHQHHSNKPPPGAAVQPATLLIPPKLQSIYTIPTTTFPPSSPMRNDFPSSPSRSFPPPQQYGSLGQQHTQPYSSPRTSFVAGPTAPSSPPPMMPFVITPAADQPPRIVPHISSPPITALHHQQHDQPPRILPVEQRQHQHQQQRQPPDWKRPRTATPSSSSSSSMLLPPPPQRSQLPFDQRVVGPPSSLMSPSGALQGRTHSRSGRRDTAMDGLSALSTAAFLRLDDESEM